MGHSVRRHGAGAARGLSFGTKRYAETEKRGRNVFRVVAGTTALRGMFRRCSRGGEGPIKRGAPLLRERHTRPSRWSPRPTEIWGRWRSRTLVNIPHRCAALILIRCLFNRRIDVNLFHYHWDFPVEIVFGRSDVEGECEHREKNFVGQILVLTCTLEFFG